MSLRHDYPVGTSVELHPATDSWMRGDRYGTVVGYGRGGVRLRIKMDRSGKTKRFLPRDVIVVERKLNGPLKSFAQVGSNMTVIEHGDITALYSYETPVALLAPAGGYMTEKKWSNTTSKHISKFFEAYGYDKRGARKLPQEDIEAIVRSGAESKHFPINVDPTPAEKRAVFESLTRRRGNPAGQLWYPGGVAIGRFNMGEAGTRYYVIPVESTHGWDFPTLVHMFPDNLRPDGLALAEARLGYEHSGQQGYHLFKVRVNGKWSRPLRLRTSLTEIPGVK